MILSYHRMGIIFVIFVWALASHDHSQMYVNNENSKYHKHEQNTAWDILFSQSTVCELCLVRVSCVWSV